MIFVGNELSCYLLVSTCVYVSYFLFHYLFSISVVGFDTSFLYSVALPTIISVHLGTGSGCSLCAWNCCAPKLILKLATLRFNFETSFL